MNLRSSFTFCLLYLVALRPAVDPDLFWHLKTGWFVTMTNRLPNFDPFTSSDSPWMLHEWLSQVVMWHIYLLGGWNGLAIFFAFIAAGAFFLMTKLTPGYKNLSSFLAVAGAFTAAPMLGARPQVFTLFGVAIVVYVLESKKPSYWLVPLFVVWSNVHAGFVLGLALLLVYSLFQRRVDQLVTAGLIVPIVGLFNTNYGMGVWLYPFQTTLFNEQMQGYIAEWQSPDFHNVAYWPYLLLILLILWGMADSVNWPEPLEMVLICGAIAAGLVSVRHIPPAVIILLPRLIKILSTTGTGNTVEESLKQLALPGGKFAIPLVICALFGLSIATHHKLQNTEQLIADSYPAAAIKFLPISDEVFNAYEWGGYLIFANKRPWIDGRADIHTGRIADYIAISRGEMEIPAGVNHALLKPNSALANLLLAKGWERVFTSETAVVLAAP